MDDLPNLLAIREQGLGKDADAEVRLPQINAEWTVSAEGVRVAHQSAAQGRLLRFFQKGVSLAAHAIRKHQGTKLLVERWVPKQGCICAVTGQLP